MMLKKIFCLLSLFPFSLYSDCELELEAPSIYWEGSGAGGYEIFSSDEYIQEVTFTVNLKDDGDDDDDDADDSSKKRHSSAKRRGGGDCSYYVTISSKKGGQQNRELFGKGSNRLEYQIYSDRSKTHVIKDSQDAVSSNDVIEGSSSSDSGSASKQETFYIVIPAGQMVESGFYDDTLELKVFEGTVGETDKESDSQSISFTANVPSVVQMSLVDPGGAFDEYDLMQTLEFGELIENDEQRFDIRIRSNTGYNISWDSENRGYLQHEDGLRDGKIPYSFYADGKELKVQGRNSLSKHRKVTNQDGDVFHMSVKIGAIDYSKAGGYSDTISVTYTTTE